MSYSNKFLRNFRPVFFGILKEKQMKPERVELEIIDEEEDGYGIFEPAGVREVLEQLAEDLNFLTIYTERPAYFYEFAETMYEENGLIVMLFPKRCLWDAARGMSRRQDGSLPDMTSVPGNAGRCLRRQTEHVWQLVLDFEWEGNCYLGQTRAGRYYIPIHKKPWKQGENLDITVPFGYNTVIVKGIQDKRKRPERDRFDEAFYK